LTRVGNGTYTKDVAVLDGDEERIIRLPDPGNEDLWNLVSQPSA
jgi:hypothetical protein